VRRQEETVEESDDSEDEEEDSDYEENEDKDESISNYLQSGPEPNLSDVGSYYDNFQHNLSHSHVPLNNFVDANTANDLEIYSDINEDNSQDWTTSILNNSSTNRRISWNPRFGVPESEAAVAVESILNADDEVEGDISVDLSGIDGLDDNLEDDNEEEDDEEGDDDEDDEEDDEEEDNGYMGGEGHQQHVDVQMQCAIKSILDMPSVHQQSHQSHNNSYYHNHNHSSLPPHLNDFRNLEYPHIPNIHHQRRTDASMRNYSGHSTGVNDPILDEAVKSILS
jgi:hypothetical protein